MKKLTLLLFFLVSAGELLSIVFQMNELQLVCKPLIMITLGAYYFQRASDNRSVLAIMAILFSLGGDIALMMDSSDQIFFMVGLISFLISHIFYILVYRQHRVNEIADALVGIQKLRVAFPIVLAGTGLVVILYPSLGALQFPVMIYALVLVVMVLNALFRYGRTNFKSFWLVFGGAMLFMISDSVLAINKFLHPVPNSGLYIMSTYIAAQFLIIEGLCAHFDREGNPLHKELKGKTQRVTK